MDLVLVVVLMPVAVYALIGGVRAARWLAEARRKAPPPVPVDRLAANLRRLRAELDETETSAELTAKRHRVRSVRGAYLDTLAEACLRLDVTPPPGDARPRRTSTGPRRRSPRVVSTSVTTSRAPAY